MLDEPGLVGDGEFRSNCSEGCGSGSCASFPIGCGLGFCCNQAPVYIPIELCPGGCSSSICETTFFSVYCGVRMGKVCAPDFTKETICIDRVDLEPYTSLIVGLVVYTILASCVLSFAVYLIARKAKIEELVASKNGILKDSSKIVHLMICIFGTLFVPLVSIPCLLRAKSRGYKDGIKKFHEFQTLSSSLTFSKPGEVGIPIAQVFNENQI